MRVTLSLLGWNAFFEEAFAPYKEKGWVPARLIRETKINFTALLSDGEDVEALVSGKVWNEATCDADLPAVGDWVALDLGQENDPAIIRARLPRKSCFSRKEPGKSSAEQVLATNIDYVVVVTEPGADFNLRRMERYLTLIARSNASPLIILNKIDTHSKEETQESLALLRTLSPNTPVLPMSAQQGKGLAGFQKYLKKGITLTITGSSGVGKSTLINLLLGDEWMWTGEINEVTGKGRHTTVARELVLLPRGSMLIDNPGMREIQMWTNEQTLRESFAELTALTSECQFSDCSHTKEKNCALQAAVRDGRLNAERYEHFLQLEEEIASLLRRQKKRQMNVERAHKRHTKIKARNYNDRVDNEQQKNPNHYK